MEPEREFLENASTMIEYARKEVKQFMDWTNRRTVYGATAESITNDLEVLLEDVKRLKQEYLNREQIIDKVTGPPSKQKV